MQTIHLVNVTEIDLALLVYFIHHYHVHVCILMIVYLPCLSVLFCSWKGLFSCNQFLSNESMRYEEFNIYSESFYLHFH
jgi:hypothetical protein